MPLQLWVGNYPGWYILYYSIISFKYGDTMGGQVDLIDQIIILKVVYV